jgi:photosystem II stability/assembly factor-like uncharacterized protein
MRRVLLVATLAAAVLAVAAPASAGKPTWRQVDTGTTAHFRGLSVVSADVAWVSGYKVTPTEAVFGRVLRTTDGGRTWHHVTPPHAAGLQFRDIEAINARTAVAMAIGESPSDMRMYRTDNAGATWRRTYTNRAETAFFDCMAFLDRRNGFVLSDPVHGKFRVLETWNGGRSWHVTNPAGMPPALEREFGFAASGQCITTRGARHVYFGTSAGRVFHSADKGRTWDVTRAPVRAGGTSGLFALAFRNADDGVAVGGDYAHPYNSPRAVAFTTNGGSTWRPARGQTGEYRSGVAYIPNASRTVVAVGITGTDVSYDGGRTWTKFSRRSYDTIDCAGSAACYAAGDDGKVARLRP